jgi:hypothetical protein
MFDAIGHIGIVLARLLNGYAFWKVADARLCAVASGILGARLFTYNGKIARSNPTTAPTIRRLTRPASEAQSRLHRQRFLN